MLDYLQGQLLCAVGVFISLFALTAADVATVAESAKVPTVMELDAVRAKQVIALANWDACQAPGPPSFGARIANLPKRASPLLIRKYHSGRKAACRRHLPLIMAFNQSMFTTRSARPFSPSTTLNLPEVAICAL